MKISRFLKLLFLLLLLEPLSMGWAATKETAVFTLVKGTVKVLSLKGVTRKVKTGKSVKVGDTIQVGKEAQAKVGLPDGSSLNLSANTHLTITSLSLPSPDRKNFSFKLAIGKLFAQVHKLVSAKSSFEIEAGGVVCGVRGTEFSLGFNPETKQMDLDVFNGAVGAAGSGVTQVFKGGQSGHFTGGHWDGKIGNAPPPPKGGGKEDNGGSKGSGGTGSSGTGGSGNGGNSTGNNTGNAGGGTNPTGTGNNPLDSTGGSPAGGDTNGSSSGLQPNACLGDLNNQFTAGIVVNSNNNLNSAQQNILIHLVVP